MRVLVLGGTGVVGRLTVAELLRRGHDVRAVSRRGEAPPGALGFAGDITTGDGVAAAVDGVECIVDCANVTTTRAASAVRFFEESTRRVGELARAAGVGHYVVLSIVGIDAAPTGYYLGKLQHERAALAGPVPATVLRATQFHEFAGQVLQRTGFGPLAVVPRMLTQPIAGAEVAAALAEVAEAPPAGRVPDIGGPRREQLVELARLLVRSRGERSRVVSLRMPGALGRAMRSGDLTLGAGGVVRGPSYREWLAHGRA